MDGPFLIPVAVFVAICVLVAISALAKIKDKETQVINSLRIEELEHTRRMAELQQELQKVKAG